MLRRLNVPAIEEKPANPAETRPRQLQELIAGLPHNNHRAAARLLLDELEKLNRQAFPVDVRLTALELYRPTILNAVLGLSRQYCNQSLPLQETAKSQADLAQQLFIELAIGYKQAILTEEDRLFTIGDDNQLALLVQRAMDALGRLLRIHHLTYSAPPAGIWSELHLLYLHALQLSLQNLSVPDESEESSINRAYKHALLLSLANPSHLNSVDIERVIDYLDRFADLAQLHPLGIPEKSAGVFLIHLKTDAPPIPLAKNSRDADARTDILLITIELARQVHQHIKDLQADSRPIILDLPNEAMVDQRYRDMLQHLLKQWGNPPKRIFQRAEKNSNTNLCVGMTALHFFLGEENSRTSKNLTSDATRVEVSFTNSPIDSGSAAMFKSARWVVVNESPGGLALSASSLAHGNLRVGEILGLKPEHASQWGVAILRWATNAENGALQIGAQMIAPTAKPVEITTTDEPQHELALLLPELTTLKQAATLVTTRGIYKPARTLRLNENGKTADIMLTRLVERTNNYERFQFSRL